MKTSYAPVKLPVNVKTALAGESNYYRIVNEDDQVRLDTITVNKTQIRITHRMIKEDLIDESGTLTQTGEHIREQLLINIEFAEHGIPHQYYEDFENPNIFKFVLLELGLKPDADEILITAIQPPKPATRNPKPAQEVHQ